MGSACKVKAAGIYSHASVVQKAAASASSGLHSVHNQHTFIGTNINTAHEASVIATELLVQLSHSLLEMIDSSCFKSCASYCGYEYEDTNV